MLTITELKRWFDAHREKIKGDYFDFLRIPSISADPSYQVHCSNCADWLVSYFSQGGFVARRIETSSLPLVFAQDLSAGPTKPTLLIYGHYDVQPVDPLDLWITPPFEPVEREGSIFARGAVDDKGQIFYAILAALSWKKLGHPLPVNVKFCIEGEEEFHSLGLSQILPHLGETLKADYLLVVDFDQFAPDIPAVSLGARGIVALEVTIYGSKSDLHSGLYGGIAYNPNRALVELLGKLWDEKGRVRVPGFYEGIIELTPEELKMYQCRHDRSYYTKTLGIEAFGGEKNKSLHEASCFRPTLELNGIFGGYSGPGIKTVIPASSHAKITSRLVLGQDPEKITESIASFLEAEIVQGMKLEIKRHKGDRAFRIDPKSKLPGVIAKAAEEVTKNKCRYVVSGGSIPIVPQLIEASGAQVAGMGYGLVDDSIHAPNEKFDMHRLGQGFLTIGRALGLLE